MTEITNLDTLSLKGKQDFVSCMSAFCVAGGVENIILQNINFERVDVILDEDEEGADAIIEGVVGTIKNRESQGFDLKHGFCKALELSEPPTSNKLILRLLERRDLLESILFSIETNQNDVELSKLAYCLLCRLLDESKKKKELALQLLILNIRHVVQQSLETETDDADMYAITCKFLSLVLRNVSDCGELSVIDTCRGLLQYLIVALQKWYEEEEVLEFGLSCVAILLQCFQLDARTHVQESFKENNYHAWIIKVADYHSDKGI